MANAPEQLEALAARLGRAEKRIADIRLEADVLADEITIVKHLIRAKRPRSPPLNFAFASLSPEFVRESLSPELIPKRHKSLS